MKYHIGKNTVQETLVIPLFGRLVCSGRFPQLFSDLQCEAEAYLQTHPNAAVVNLGCGLDDTFRKCDNGLCHGCNIDLKDVIAVRNELLPAQCFSRQAYSVISGQRMSKACSPVWRNAFPALFLSSIPATGGVRK